MDYAGKLYRALNPIHARAPLSGRGAELYGGRFNPLGMPALHTSLSVTTAGRHQPTTLVYYDAAIRDVFDSRDTEALEATGMDAARVADAAWHDRMREKEAPTQAFARRLITSGYPALRVCSFAPGATAEDLNLVLWAWGDAAPARLTLIDGEGRQRR